ncbi:MAG TPA: endonuclease/exonuclease/phosphatase family protein [Bryobacteraceae bacterium]|nr:endonuclease/exonuclease/phosphatase family protein [Bryobacteraceae bacterium]
MTKLTALLLAAVSIGMCQPLRVMTFNVRYPAKSDGPNVWEARRDLLTATIKDKDPDLLGTQELFYEQGQYIVEKLPAYTWFGVSRRGNREDEHMGVFYKKDRLKLIESGNFWLSEKPEEPGSFAWEMSLPRMVTWGLFEVRDSGRRFYYYNTHLAHRREDEQARLNSARLIMERIAKLPQDAPFILTGDFNAPAGGAVYKILDEQLEEAWAAAARRTGPEGTFNGFKGNTSGARIDWIFTRGLKAREAETVTKNDGGRYPSDHYPVFAVLEFTTAR